MNNNKDFFENIVNKSGGKLDRDTLQKAARTHNTNDLIKKLSDSDKQKLENILSDQEKLKKVLESPEAKMLWKLFGGANTPKNPSSGQAADSNSQQNSGTNRASGHSAGGKNG